jgi:hypothetical protein
MMLIKILLIIIIIIIINKLLIIIIIIKLIQKMCIIDAYKLFGPKLELRGRGRETGT